MNFRSHEELMPADTFIEPEVALEQLLLSTKNDDEEDRTMEQINELEFNENTTGLFFLTYDSYFGAA